MHEYTSTARVWGLSCPGFPEEVSRARRWTRDVLRGSPFAEDAELIVSELSANAILHTASGLESGSFHLAVA
ncbi:ATP-binding protein, partial [Streptomyces sp. NPDC052015]